MDPYRAFEKEEDHIDEMWQAGLISDAERNAELRALAREYAEMAREAAEEAAHAAYEQERSRW